MNADPNDLDDYIRRTFGVDLRTYLNRAIAAYRTDAAYMTAMAIAHNRATDRTRRAQAKRREVDGQTYD